MASGSEISLMKSEDDVAEYYQQQVEMLEGFSEMVALAERGFVPGMSKIIAGVIEHRISELLPSQTSLINMLRFCARNTNPIAKHQSLALISL
ncbi:unnamed protein product [Amaranthus hypochondriacus]